MDELAQEYHLPDNLFRLRIHASSPLRRDDGGRRSVWGRTIMSVSWRCSPGLTSKSRRRPLIRQAPKRLLGTDQILHVQGSPENVSTLAQGRRDWGSSRRWSSRGCSHEEAG